MDDSRLPIRRFPLARTPQELQAVAAAEVENFRRTVRRILFWRNVRSLLWALGVVSLLAWIATLAFAAGPAVTLGVALLTFPQAFGWLICLRLVAWGLQPWKRSK